MNIKDFIEKYSEAIEIEDVTSVTEETNFRDLSEWSSISVMLTIAFFDEEFEKEIGNAELNSCSTILDLYNLAVS